MRLPPFYKTVKVHAEDYTSSLAMGYSITFIVSSVSGNLPCVCPGFN
jgi:hypothetical protein